MEKWDVSGKVVLLGTPAEEGGYGKVLLLKQGAYEGMDVCLMCHPAPGPPHGTSLSSSLALNRIEVEYTGHTAHAALSPWEGQNALDAAVLAYMNISALRQQLKPSHRVHGIIEGRDWAANIVPDYAKLNYYVRAPTLAEVEVTVPRIVACFEAAALATSCKVETKIVSGTADIRQNQALGDEVANISQSRYGPVDFVYGISSASTDFGDITYALPALHPGFSIPTEPNGGNHTVAFTKAARTMEAHKACLNVAVALAATGARVLTDDAFHEKVKNAFEEDKKKRSL
jgi:amidohydrolase